MNSGPTQPNRGPTTPALAVLASRHLPSWLAAQNLSLACTTCQAGKILLIGAVAEERLAIFERSFGRCTGLWGDGQTLWLGTGFQLWKFENVLPEGERSGNCDRLYVPRAAYTIGDVDIHDVAVDGTGGVVFVSTLFNCLAAPSPRYSFEALWRPAFISRLAAEDRCHLNGLAIVDGRPRYATACAESDAVDGWRDRRRDGGCLLDVDSGEVVVAGLSMPHSPRWYRGHAWLLNSGTGEFGRVDLDRGRFEPITFCPGFTRGLAFAGDHAIVGLSRPRDASFRGLALDEGLVNRRTAAWCGLMVIDLRSGDAAHWMRIEGTVSEVYDVVALPGVARPKMLGFLTDEIQRDLWVADGGKVRHWCGEPSA